MDIERSEDHVLLADMLRRFLAERCTLERRNETAWTAPFYDAVAWGDLAELGVLGAFVPEELGGLGGSAEDIAVVFEEVGHAMSTEPFLATLMGLRALAALGEEDLLADVMSCNRRVALAVFEPGVAQDLAGLSTRADAEARLTGRKSAVYGAPGADLILVAAQNGTGLGLYLIDDLTHADIIAAPMQEGGGIADLVLKDCPARALSTDAAALVEDILDLGRIALAAEAVGAMDRLTDMTIEYLKQRQQFGRAIAQFQALQHRVVDMKVAADQARAITMRAVASYGGADQARHVSMAKNLIGRAAELCAEEAIQLHGGIGMTWEYPGSHYAKRLIMIDHQLGGRHDHAMRLVALNRARAA